MPGVSRQRNSERLRGTLCNSGFLRHNKKMFIDNIIVTCVPRSVEKIREGR